MSKIVVLTLVASVATAGETSLRKLYTFEKPDAVVDWFAVDDRVMGGVSQSRLVSSAEGASFMGDLSLESGGGFASVRSREAHLDLSDYTALVLRVRGDGKRYKLSLRTDRRYDGIVYQASFNTQLDEWQEIVLPLGTFSATWRGRAVPGAEPLDRARVISLGLLVADSQSGAFRLDLAWIGALND